MALDSLIKKAISTFVLAGLSLAAYSPEINADGRGRLFRRNYPTQTYKRQYSTSVEIRDNTDAENRALDRAYKEREEPAPPAPPVLNDPAIFTGKELQDLQKMYAEVLGGMITTFIENYAKEIDKNSKK